MRMWLAQTIIATGFALMPKPVRRMVRMMLLYHVPNALTEDEKAEVRAAKLKINIS